MKIPNLVKMSKRSWTLIQPFLLFSVKLTHIYSIYTPIDSSAFRIIAVNHIGLFRTY